MCICSCTCAADEALITDPPVAVCEYECFACRAAGSCHAMTCKTNLSARSFGSNALPLLLCKLVGFATVFAPLVLAVFMLVIQSPPHANTQLAHVSLSHASRLFSHLCKFHSAVCTLRLLCVWARGQPNDLSFYHFPHFADPARAASLRAGGFFSHHPTQQL